MKYILTILLILTSSVHAEQFELIASLTTGVKKYSGTNNLDIYIQINDSEKFILDNPKKDDFRTGAVDTFKGMMFDIPLKDIKKITIGADAGSDKWLLRKIEIQIKSGDKISNKLTFKTKVWISKDASDKAKTKKSFYLRNRKIVFKK